MKTFRLLSTSLMLAALGIGAMMPQSAQAARVTGKSAAKPSNFPAIKAQLLKQGRVGRQAYNQLKAAYRSESRLRDQRGTAFDRVNRAERVYNANKTDRNMTAWREAVAAFRPVADAHNNALNALRSAQQTVGFTREGRHSELVALRAANRARAERRLAVRLAQQGQPRFNAGAQIAPTKIGGLRFAQPITIAANPAAFPAQALLPANAPAPGGYAPAPAAPAMIYQNGYDQAGQTLRY